MNPVDIVKAVDDAINAGDVEKALTFYVDDVRARAPDPEGPGLRERVGKDALRRVLEADRERGVKFLCKRCVCEGDLAAAEAENVGTFDGKTVHQPVGVFYQIADGKIASVTVYYDRLGLRKAVQDVE